MKILAVNKVILVVLLMQSIYFIAASAISQLYVPELWNILMIMLPLIGIGSGSMIIAITLKPTHRLEAKHVRRLATINLILTLFLALLFAY